MNKDEVQRIPRLDPFVDTIRQTMSEPAQNAVRTELVIQMVAQLQDALTGPFMSGTEAYRIFVRTISVLNVFLPEGQAAVSRSQTAAPLRFADAERINPHQGLLDLYCHALGRAATPDRVAALAAADVANIAAATGLDEVEVLRRWRQWTDVQTPPLRTSTINRVAHRGQPSLPSKECAC